MKHGYVMGIDIGTQGSKVIVMDDHGTIVAKSNQTYSFEVPHTGWAEQHPIIWWQSVCRALKEIWGQGVNANQIEAIGVSGQMHSLVLLDKNDKELGNAILWNDGRTEKECDEIKERIGKNKLLTITRNEVLPGFTAPKILWIKHNEPDKYKQINHIMLPKDYIVFKLSGIFSCDVSDASGTSLFDVENRIWSEEILDALYIPRDWIPPVYESKEIVAKVKPSVTADTGLAAGTKIVAGAGDNAAAALGNGIFKEGTGVVSIGTSGTVFAPLQRLPTIGEDGRQQTLHLFCHCLPDTWHAMGVTLSAGMSLKWFKNNFSDESYDTFLQGIDKIPSGSEGLLYLPYLNGERTPHNNPNAKGVFFGMNYKHTKKHFTRALMEGIAYSLKDCYELVKQCNIDIKELYVTGGASKSSDLRQILTDILAEPLTVFPEREGPAFGAALLAGLGAGVWTSSNDFPSFFENGKRTHINKNNSLLYQKDYIKYKALYTNIESLF